MNIHPNGYGFTPPTELIDTARARRIELQRLGYDPVPVAHRDKAPVTKGWQTAAFNFTNDPIVQMRGVWLLSTGLRHSNTVMLDLDIEHPDDADNAFNIVEAIAPCGAVRSRDGSNKIGVLYRKAHDWTGGKKFPLREGQIEVRAMKGMQTVIDGEHVSSTDADIRRYCWKAGEAPWERPWEALATLSAQQAEQQIVLAIVAAQPPMQGAAAALRGDPITKAQAAETIARQKAGVHDATMTLAGIHAERWVDMHVAIAMIEDHFLLTPKDLRDDRWAARLADVPRCVADIYHKAGRDPASNARNFNAYLATGGAA